MHDTTTRSVVSYDDVVFTGLWLQTDKNTTVRMKNNLEGTIRVESPPVAYLDGGTSMASFFNTLVKPLEKSEQELDPASRLDGWRGR